MNTRFIATVPIVVGILLFDQSISDSRNH